MGLCPHRGPVVNIGMVAVAALVAVVIVVHGVIFLIARRVGLYNVVGIAWGAGSSSTRRTVTGLNGTPPWRRLATSCPHCASPISPWLSFENATSSVVAARSILLGPLHRRARRHPR
jgi:hypothetical protein